MGNSGGKNRKDLSTRSTNKIDIYYESRPNSDLLDTTLLPNLLQETKFAEVEVRELHQIFNNYSTNGVLERAKWDEVLSRLESFGVQKLKDTALGDRLFGEFDINKDGTIDCREFLCGVSLLCKGSAEDKLRLTFQAYDLDNSGTISKEEMLSLFCDTYSHAIRALHALQTYHSVEVESPPIQEFTHSFRQLMSEAIDSAWLQLDTNHDGILNFEEFKNFALANPQITATLNGLKSEVKMSLI
eukprot:TRINITY_DN1490_c6_g1_i1.p1 TRINITY_DN1490_c6_g1~~TRINITY_DN1490_c6_g1_i1.p1  ORF type:complete len:253 (+),score=101.82 TRINITY_DN1490_c6_g1_i1:31-759(+)